MMSKTIVDMPKVTQMLDAGWEVRLYKGEMGSYEVRAIHPQPSMRGIVKRKLRDNAGPEHVVYEGMTLLETIEECHFDGEALMTDDFTPEQALTRLAYKIFGDII